MNIFQCVYCNQYEELVRTGRDGGKAHKNGIIIITVAIVVNIFALAVLLILMGKGGFLTGPAHRIADMAGSGKAAGKLIAAVLIVIIGAIVWFTLGRDSYFEKTIYDFNGLPEDLQKRATRTGTIYLFGSVGLFLLLMGIMIFMH